ncbi:4'-phosphopantetheinyl transferase family protein [Sulfuritalea sp.]|uniref:4'-phosphopantetheinyl transferase family protein n=1 Tax=Sulfuritalea sp. TaxID=2480090 RepID=UPI00286DFFB1|nr:4'-phosphopantetheinyl transferase superfamily protein [Sulfuritalea sp.]
MITIEPEDVHLWAIFDHERIADSLVDHYRCAILNDEERRREVGYLAASARRQYVIARALLRTAVAQCAGLDPTELVFSASASGKPALAGQHANAGLIEFSISHTAGAIVLGVAQNRRIGVDVERVKTRCFSAQSLGRFFDEDECTAIMAEPHSMRPAVFCRYWTLKEAYVKAVGATLPTALRSVRFALYEGRIAAVFPPALSPGPRWHFRLYQPTSDHLLSLCVEAPDGRDMRCIPHQEMSPVAENGADWPMLLDSQ